MNEYGGAGEISEAYRIKLALTLISLCPLTHELVNSCTKIYNLLTNESGHALDLLSTSFVHHADINFTLSKESTLLAIPNKLGEIGDFLIR